MNWYNSLSKWAALGACMLAMSSVAASAQSAEETVVYMLHGVTDTPVAIPSNQIGLIEPAKDGYGVDLYRGKVLGTSLRYKRIDDCHYDMTIYEPESGSPSKEVVEMGTLTLDWSKASGVKVVSDPEASSASPKKLVSVDGLAISSCSSKVPNVCESLNIKRVLSLIVNVGDPERTAKAYSYFKDKYCEGAAF